MRYPGPKHGDLIDPRSKTCYSFYETYFDLLEAIRGTSIPHNTLKTWSRKQWIYTRKVPRHTKYGNAERLQIRGDSLVSVYAYYDSMPRRGTTIREASRLIGITCEDVWKLHEEGQIHVHTARLEGPRPSRSESGRTGPSPVVDLDSVERYLARIKERTRDFPMDSADAASYLGISKQMVGVWCARGELIAIRVRGHLRINPISAKELKHVLKTPQSKLRYQKLEQLRNRNKILRERRWPDEFLAEESLPKAA